MQKLNPSVARLHRYHRCVGTRVGRCRIIEPTLTAALRTVACDLGTETEYQIEANLYKLLLYEEGCFFARHRDNERLDGMFGTLVLELPSVYEGAELSVWSPLTPNEKVTYTFNGGKGGSGGGGSCGDAGSLKKKQKKKQKNDETLPGLHFAAFYADCYHEVSKLTSGHRVALVYHLTATPVTKRLLAHLPTVQSPSQPADESIAIQLARAVNEFGSEGEEAYPRTWEWEEEVVDERPSARSRLLRIDNTWKKWPGKPKKLAVVLSHNYTPASLTGIHALKGSDRAIAELIRAAAYRSPVNGEVSPDGKPYFDAAVALSVVHDYGEGIAMNKDSEETVTFFTTGPLIPILSSEADKDVVHVVPLDLGPKDVHDREAAHHPSWFGGQEDLGRPYEFEGPYEGWAPGYNSRGPILYGEQAWMKLKIGNHSLPIFSHEILFASEEAASKFRKDENNHGVHTIVESDPKEIEFREYSFDAAFGIKFFHSHLSLYCFGFSFPQWEMECRTWVGSTREQSSSSGPRQTARPLNCRPKVDRQCRMAARKNRARRRSK